jgi:hypothetical protein
MTARRKPARRDDQVAGTDPDAVGTSPSDTARRVLFVPWRTMNVPSRELTREDLELIEFASQIVDANTDGEDGVHNLFGIFIRHARHVLVTGNVVSGNCQGILVLDDGPRGSAGNATIQFNRVFDNNKFCKKHEETPVDTRGGGILLLGATHTLVTHNSVTGNAGKTFNSGGIVVLSAKPLTPRCRAWKTAWQARIPPERWRSGAARGRHDRPRRTGRLPGDGGLVATELQRFRLQCWSLPDFGRLLTDAGFADISVTADYREDCQPGPDSRTWTFHAVRPR